MAHWIFKCNPDYYRLEARLTNPNTATTWVVTRYADQIGRGDTVYLWLTGKRRGIRAVLKVDSNPQMMAEIEHERQYWEGEHSEECVRVMATITNRSVDLTADELRQVPGLENLSMFHGFQQQTNFPVTPAEGAIIDRLIREASVVTGEVR